MLYLLVFVVGFFAGIAAAVSVKKDEWDNENDHTKYEAIWSNSEYYDDDDDGYEIDDWADLEYDSLLDTDDEE